MGKLLGIFDPLLGRLRTTDSIINNYYGGGSGGTTIIETTPTPTAVDNLLLEIGDQLLFEDGSAIQLEA